MFCVFFLIFDIFSIVVYFSNAKGCLVIVCIHRKIIPGQFIVDEWWQESLLHFSAEEEQFDLKIKVQHSSTTQA